MRTLVWFRGKDLRLSDHQPLRSALNGEVIPLFVLEPRHLDASQASKRPHAAQHEWDALGELQHSIERTGSRMWFEPGECAEVVPRLARRWQVDRVVAYRCVEPFARTQAEAIRRALPMPLELFEGETLLPPGSLRTTAGEPYSVFTPFFRAFLERFAPARPEPAPKHLPELPSVVRSSAPRFLQLPPFILERNPRVVVGGERAARERLRTFLRSAVARYAAERDRLDLAGTSRLSQDLHFGTLSIRTVWWEVERAIGECAAFHAFRKELIWREFAHSTLWDRPEVLAAPYRSEFSGFWPRLDRVKWRAWVNGMTGYPLVDAAARQLVAEGFVHNRARMVAASFLTKHLLIDYSHGEAHYMKFLVDGDAAQNNAGWQWSAGCGTDAQPYFRVFHPVLQGKKFDTEGHYVRRWVPELAELPARFLHRPWEASAPVLDRAGISLGRDYPPPIVDHPSARRAFLARARSHLRTVERAGPDGKK